MVAGKSQFTDEFNAMASAGDTPLMGAVQAGDMARVKSLVEGGADIHATNVIGNTAMHCAGATGQTEIARYLKEKGADINAQNNIGATPFFLAVINSRVQAGAKLLLLGADKNIRSIQDYTAYERADLVGLSHIAKEIETTISRYHANRAKLAHKNKGRKGGK